MVDSGQIKLNRKAIEMQVLRQTFHNPQDTRVSSRWKKAFGFRQEFPANMAAVKLRAIGSEGLSIIGMEDAEHSSTFSYSFDLFSP